MGSKHPLVAGRAVTITGDAADQYFGALEEGADATDGVLRVLLRLVRPDDVVVEVGANLGIHTIALSRAAHDGRVFAVEPAARTAGYLRTNLEANDARNVTVVHAAMSAQPGSVDLYVNREYAAGSMVVQHASPVLQSHLGTAQPADQPQPDDPTTTPWGGIETVTTMTVDQLTADLERVDLVKIDTEGHDMQVLAGARETLRRFRPAVALEFSSFALTLHESMLPADALSTIRDTFDRVFVIEPSGALVPVVSDTDAWKLLHANATVRPVHDLLCLFDGTVALARVLADPLAHEMPASEAAEPAAGPDLEAEVAQLRHDLDDTREHLASAVAERDRLQAEIDALRSTRSWRAMEPLRRVRRFLRSS